MKQYQHLLNIQPLLVQVELTEACNLACRFCYNSQQPKYNSKAIEMMEALAAQGVMQLTLTGGEPLLHPDFFSILEKATLLFPNVMILSNGTLMTKENIERICRYNVMSVGISIHGDEQTHEAMTNKPGSFRQAMDAIGHYIRLDKVPVATNFVLNNANKDIFEKVLKNNLDFGIKFQTVTRFVPVGIGSTASDLEITHGDMIRAMETADAFVKMHKDFHIEFAEAVPFCAIPKHISHFVNTCSYGYDRFYADVNGNLLVCGLSRVPLGGNILSQPISQIKAQSDVYSAYIHGEQLPSTCKSCALVDGCHGGCRASAMKDGRWKGTPDSLCIRNQIKERKA